MQFAYIGSELDDMDGVIGTILGNMARTVQAPQAQQSDELLPEVELPDNWKKFKETLFSFQNMYMHTTRDVRENENKLSHTKAEHRALKDTLKLFEGSSLKDKFSELVAEFEKEENIEELEEYVKTLKATAKAMRQVLESTNVDQVVKFQCFVCMDRSIDTFLDPCGHVLCSACWRRANSPACPACRVQVRPKKVYTLT
jgi:Skp family chaperone for outer membrane proteins